MSTVLQVDNDADAIVEILEQDAHLDGSLVDDLAFGIARLNMEHGAKNFIETTDTEVILTIKIPR